jgi:Mycothiol maleylpyruvate isomerase N-terminal domain.
VTAHHIASSYESATRIIKTIASGQALPRFTPEMLDEMNARHARDFAGCTKAETIALHREGAAAAAAAVRGLSDAELAETGTVFTGMPPVSAEHLIKRILLAHMDAHFGSIRKTIGG